MARVLQILFLCVLRLLLEIFFPDESVSPSVTFAVDSIVGNLKL